jgi:hypothetical protein
MTYFALVYHRPSRKIIERFDFTEAEHDVAWDQHERLIRKYLGQRDFEVVLLGSHDEASLRATHGRYFINENAA